MDDGELFELVGYGWSLPIRVKLIQEALYEVRLADIPLLKKQRIEAEAALKVHSHTRECDRWYFSTKGLNATAVKSGHTDPEDVVVWNAPQEWHVAKTNFHEAYANSRYAVIRNPTTCAIWFDMVCKFMSQWLLAGNEVDLGFAKLNALPARVNWKEAVLGFL